MVRWLLRRDILGVAGRANGSDVQQLGSASWVPFDRRTWRHLFFRIRPFRREIALKEELNCGYEVVLGPGTIRVYQCRQGRKGRRVFGSPYKQSGNVGEEHGTDFNIFVSKGDFILVGW